MTGFLAQVNDLFRKAQAESDAQLLARFVHERDQEAFRLLLVRHGPLVRGICRRWLPCHADSDDAFQATFLVLARRAGCIRQPERLPNWLHSVALRTARKLRFRLKLHRRLEEARAELPDPITPPVLPTSDLARLLDEELGRLPEKLRLPMLLFHVQGLSRRDVATRLEIPEGTLATWLNQARLLLRKRLVRRGVVPAVALPLLASQADAVSPALIQATTEAAVSFTYSSTALVASAGVVRLAKGVLQMLMVKRLTAASAALFLVFFLGAGIGLFLKEHSGRPGFAAEPVPARPTGPIDGLRVQIFENNGQIGKIIFEEKDDRVQFNSIAALGRYLKRVRAADKTLPESITVVTNAEARYATVNEVMQVCKEAGFGVHLTGLKTDGGTILLGGSKNFDQDRIEVLRRLEALQKQRDELIERLREMEALIAKMRPVDNRLDLDQQKTQIVPSSPYHKKVLNIPAAAQPAQSGSLPPANRADHGLQLGEARANLTVAQAAAAMANVELKSAKETVRLALSDLDRHKKSGASPLEIAKAESELKQAEAALEAKQALVKLAETQIELERTRMEHVEAAHKSGQATSLPAGPGQHAPPLGDPNLQKIEAEARVRQAETLVLVLRSELKAADAKLNAAQVKLEQVSKLVAEKLASATELAQAKLEVATWQAKLEGLQAQVKNAEVQAALERARMQPQPASGPDPAPKPKGN